MENTSGAHLSGSVDAILMASGFSQRFGDEDKLLALFCGKPLAQHALDLACGFAGFGQVFFVAARPAVQRLAQGRACTLLENLHPERGARESIRLGVLASKADYYLFLPCDQPLLDEATLTKIMAVRRPGCIVEPHFEGTPGSPALFSATFRDELLALQDGQNARIIKQKHPAAVVKVPFVCPLPLCDIDTPAALAQLEANCTKN